MTATRYPDPVLTRLREVRASGRVSDVVLGVALDVLQPYASDFLSAPDYQRLIALVETPVKVATEAGLAILAEELGRALSEADARVVRRLEGLKPPPTRAG
jgi:hypothetical protein